MDDAAENSTSIVSIFAGFNHRIIVLQVWRRGDGLRGALCWCDESRIIVYSVEGNGKENCSEVLTKLYFYQNLEGMRGVFKKIFHSSCFKRYSICITIFDRENEMFSAHQSKLLFCLFLVVKVISLAHW